MNLSNLYFFKIEVIFTQSSGLNFFIEKRTPVVIIASGINTSIFTPLN